MFVASRLVAMAVRAWPRRTIDGQLAVLIPPILSSSLWLGSATGNSAAPGLLWTIFWLFPQAGSVVFGSGLAIVPFLHGGVVQHYSWLTERQFLDAVAVGMITPGPVVITVAFIGYLVAGVMGATIASLGVFSPAFKARLEQRYPGSRLATHMMPYAYDSFNMLVQAFESGQEVVPYIRRMTEYSGTAGKITKAAGSGNFRSAPAVWVIKGGKPTLADQS